MQVWDVWALTIPSHLHSNNPFAILGEELHSDSDEDEEDEATVDNVGADTVSVVEAVDVSVTSSESTEVCTTS